MNIPYERGVFDEKMTGKIARTGVEAARRKFAPELMNRLEDCDLPSC